MQAALAEQFNACERAAIESLVEKNIITKDRAAELVKDYVRVEAKAPDTRKIKISGLAQIQYDWIYANTGEYDGVSSGFNLRKLFFGATSDISDSFHATAILDFRRTKTNGSDYIMDAFLTKDVDGDYLNGKFHLGIKKVAFCYEETIPTANLSSVETSLATAYFTGSQRNESRLGFGQRYLGAFWNGSVRQAKGLKYTLAITNSINNAIYPEAHLSGKESNPAAKADFNYWLAVDYSAKIEEDHSLKFGVKSGYGPSANIVSNDKYGAIAAVNPFFEYKYKKQFVFWCEYLFANVQYGKANGTQSACPQSYNVSAEYFFEAPLAPGKFGLYARFCQLFTDGRGVAPTDMIQFCKNVASAESNSVIYERGWSYYIGLNWYIMGDTLKIQAGYEHAKFEQAHNNLNLGDESIDILRAQVQVLF
ncbi:MAG: hypothetical protein J6P03_03775 [Opitutales bacterium]|nr:hypothetical protein [Opitutales bacterium]